MKTDEVSTLTLLAPADWADYEMLDSGRGAKLERFGRYTFVRPEPQALWRPALPEERWQSADGTFEPKAEGDNGRWRFPRPLEPRWAMRYRDLTFWVEPTPFRHVGVFPEHATQWDWAGGLIRAAGRPAHVLNLFGYTGLFSLAAAAAGARVTHVDASKKTMTWARANQSLSGMEKLPIRWIVDDALKFVQREARRGARYDGFVLDPPKYGRGPGGEVWRVQESLPALLDACRAVLAPGPLFVVLSAYAIKASALSLHNAVAEMMRGRGGGVASGEMALVERSAGRLLSCSIFARWSAPGG
jgi:23S rRNA (cytosine1962-C5)-methyltransferase